MSLYLKLNEKEKEIFLKVCKKLEVNPDWLYNLINFESGWNPLAKNPISGARGLIQFTHTTAKELGYVDANDLVEKNKDISSQLLFPVLQYLLKYKPFPTEQSLYLAVFYPAYRYKEPSTQFPDSVKKYNPSIDTIQDYVNLVKKKENEEKLFFFGLIFLIIILFFKFF